MCSANRAVNSSSSAANPSGSTTGASPTGTDTSLLAASVVVFCLAVIRGPPSVLADNPNLPHGRLGMEDRHPNFYELWDNLLKEVGVP